jgi:hypothetical protein
MISTAKKTFFQVNHLLKTIIVFSQLFQTSRGTATKKKSANIGATEFYSFSFLRFRYSLGKLIPFEEIDE